MENRSINTSKLCDNLNQAINENTGSSYVMDARNNLPSNVFRGGLIEYSAKYKNMKNIDTILLTGEQVKPGIFDSSIKWNEKHFSNFMKIINETKIKRLSLQGCKLSPEIGVVIGAALKTNTSLEELAVTSNELGRNGLIAILNGLKQNSTLKILNSRSYNVSCYYWSTEELISLKELIIANKTIKKIELPNNQISKPNDIHL